MLPKDKYISLLINYGRKKVYSIGLRTKGGFEALGEGRRKIDQANPARACIIKIIRS
jgi:hypothetical protein